MFKIKATLQGDRQLMRQLSGLRQRVRTRVVKSAINSAASIVLKDAKSRVPRRTGQLARSLGKKAKAYRSAFVVVIGPRTGFKMMLDGKPVDPVHYAHLVELGTVHSRPQPFMRPALDQNKEVVLQHAQDRMRAAILREASKAA